MHCGVMLQSESASRECMRVTGETRAKAKGQNGEDDDSEVAKMVVHLGICRIDKGVYSSIVYP